MDFDRLRTFFQVARERSITKAAQTLGLDKSSVSRQLKQMEKEIGHPLLYREGGSLHLTPKGRFLEERSRRILTEIDTTKAALSSGDESLQGGLRVTTTHALISTWLSLFLPHFIEEHPKTPLQLFATDIEIGKALENADVAIRPYCPDQHWLVQTHLKRWRLHLYAAPRYLERYGLPKSVEDLNKHRLLLFHEPSKLYPDTYTMWPIRLGEKLGLKSAPHLVTNNLPGLANLVKAGTGIGLFADNSPLLKGSGCVKLLADCMYQDIDAYFIYPERNQHLQSIAELKTFLFKTIKEEQDVHHEHTKLNA